MQLEIKHIQQNLGITVVFVTHDQSEALTMSGPRRRVQPRRDPADRRPDHLYEYPRTPSSPTSSARTTALDGTVVAVAGEECDVPRLDGTGAARAPATSAPAGARLAIRPERVRLAGAARAPTGFDATAARADLSRRPDPPARRARRQAGIHHQGAGLAARPLAAPRRRDPRRLSGANRRSTCPHALQAPPSLRRPQPTARRPSPAAPKNQNRRHIMKHAASFLRAAVLSPWRCRHRIADDRHLLRRRLAEGAGQGLLRALHRRPPGSRSSPASTTASRPRSRRWSRPAT